MAPSAAFARALRPVAAPARAGALELDLQGNHAIALARLTPTLRYIQGGNVRGPCDRSLRTIRVAVED